MFQLKQLVTLCFLAASLCSFASTRHALVIGNDSYPGNSLTNARNDAQSVFSALQDAGYQATLVKDATRLQLSDSVDKFIDTLQAGDVALLYYAGHGMQVSGENFLVPIDYKLTDESSAKEQGFSLSTVLERFTSHGAATQIVILDACRDNPFQGSRSTRGGWAGMGTSAGAFLAFGTSPGSTASDAPGSGHGLFTKSLLRYLTSSDADIEQMFRLVREGVIRDSGGKQVPWVSSSLIGSFHVKPSLDLNSTPLAEIDDTQSVLPEEASRSLRTVVAQSAATLDPGEREQLQQAVLYARGARFDKAISVIKTVLSIDPRCALALRLLGLLFHATGRDIQALQAEDRAVSLSGTDVRAAAYKCALEGVIDSDSAGAHCATAVRDQPSADGYLAYSASLVNKGDLQQAYAVASQAVSLGGGDLAYALRGTIATQQGRPGLAEKDFSRAVALSFESTPQ